MSSKTLQREVTSLWDSHFDDDWLGLLDSFNDEMETLTSERFHLQHPECGPAWINGDLARMNPGEWVLMIGLNPGINPANNKIATEVIRTSAEWQQFWQDFNSDRRHWGSYFSRWGRIASACLGLNLSGADAKDFVTERIIFIEFCPFASPRWPSEREVKWEQWKEIASDNTAFRVSRQFRHLLFELGQPALVLCNGKFAAWDVKDQQFDVTGMKKQDIAYSVGITKTFPVHSGMYQPQGGNAFPVLGFQHVTSRFGERRTDALTWFAKNLLRPGATER